MAIQFSALSWSRRMRCVAVIYSLALGFQRSKRRESKSRRRNWSWRRWLWRKIWRVTFRRTWPRSSAECSRSRRSTCSDSKSCLVRDRCSCWCRRRRTATCSTWKRSSRSTSSKTTRAASRPFPSCPNPSTKSATSSPSMDTTRKFLLIFKAINTTRRWWTNPRFLHCRWFQRIILRKCRITKIIIMWLGRKWTPPKTTYNSRSPRNQRHETPSCQMQIGKDPWTLQLKMTTSTN